MMSASSTRVPATSLYHVVPRRSRAPPSTSVTMPMSAAALAATNNRASASHAREIVMEMHRHRKAAFALATHDRQGNPSILEWASNGRQREGAEWTGDRPERRQLLCRCDARRLHRDAATAPREVYFALARRQRGSRQMKQIDRNDTQQQTRGL